MRDSMTIRRLFRREVVGRLSQISSGRRFRRRGAIVLFLPALALLACRVSVDDVPAAKTPSERAALHPTPRVVPEAALRSDRQCLIHAFDGYLLANRMIEYMKVLLAAHETGLQGCVTKPTFEYLTPLFQLTSEEVSLERMPEDLVRELKEKRYKYQRFGDLDMALRSGKGKVSMEFLPFGLKLMEDNIEFLRRHIRIHPWIQAEVDAYMSPHRTKTVIGVHARRAYKIFGENSDRCYVYDGRSKVPFTNCFPEGYSGTRLLTYLKDILRFLNLKETEVVFLVATDVLEWTRENIMRNPDRGSLDLRLMNDYYNEELAASPSMKSKHFDWAVMANADYMVFQLGTYPNTAALFGRSKKIFLPKYLLGKLKGKAVMSEESREVFMYDMAGNNSRYHFFEDL